MFRVDTPTAAENLPAPTAPGTPGFFQSGNPQLGIPATIAGQDWFNMIQEEIAAVVEGAGLTLDASKADFTQLYQAIQQMIIAGGKTVKITNATFEGTVADGNAVRWDAGGGQFAKAIADGTANNRAVGLADVTNEEVILFGETRAGLVAGLTPGGRYYLSDAVAGALAAAAPDDAVRMGIAKSATQFFVDVDTGEAATGGGAGETFTYINGGATLALDGDVGPNIHMLLDANATVVPANVAAADTVYSFYLMIEQDGTGGRTLTLPAGTVWAYGEVPTFPTGAGDIAKLTLETWDNGTSWHATWVGAEYA